MLQAASHPVLHKDEQAPHWNPHVFTHDTHCDEHPLEHWLVHDVPEQFNLQLASHAVALSLPHTALHAALIHVPIQLSEQDLLHALCPQSEHARNVFSPEQTLEHEVHPLQPLIQFVAQPLPHVV